jgi:hypothetical protein
MHMTGPKPTLDDLLALFRKLAGREPTAEDIAEAKQLLDSRPSSDAHCPRLSQSRA